MYDIADQASFDALRTEWLPDKIRKYVEPKTVKMLVGNQLDRAQFREVSREHAAQLAASEDMLALETSARDATNVCDPADDASCP